MLGPLRTGRQSILLQEYCTPVVLIQDVVGYLDSLRLHAQPGPQDLSYHFINCHQLPDGGAAYIDFCLVDVATAHPVSMVNAPPVWPLIFWCVANEASTCQFNTPVFKAPRISGRSQVLLRYWIRWPSLRQSSTSGSQTLVVGNATASNVSGLAHFVTYSIIAIMEWKDLAFVWSSFDASSSTLNRSSGAAVEILWCVTCWKPS